MAIFIQNRQELEQRLVIMKTQEGWSIRALARHFTVRGEVRVKKGDRIAFLGKAADRGEPYLYFEIRHKNKARNPLFFLP